MTVEPEFDDLARELHAMRAEPRAEYARELDRHAAEWLRERPRRRLPSLRFAIPVAAAAATAAVVIALAVSGDGGDGEERLEVAVVPEQAPAEALGGATEPDAAARAEGAFAVPMAAQVEEGEPVTVRYFFTGPTEGTVELGGREAKLRVGPGAGRIEISTEGLSSGTYRLEISIPPQPLYRERIEIDD